MEKAMSKKSLLELFRDKEITKVIIPDIQRDYVMGSGGQKLNNLLEDMNKCASNQTETFDFSCLVVQKTINKELLIYDGQQRLATLVYLAAYLSEDEKLLSQLSKFQFTGRISANIILQLLCDPQNKEVKKKKNFNASDLSEFKGDKKQRNDTNYITDFSTFSINNLLKEVEKYDNISPDFLINRVIFNCVEISSDIKTKSDVEQFFMDLNSGVKLKDYEIFKAKLNNRVEKIKQQWIKYGQSEKYRECLCNWAHRLDNEWLKFFQNFISENEKLVTNNQTKYYLTEEELEIWFIKYCLHMVYLESDSVTNKKYRNQLLETEKMLSVDELSLEHIYRIYYIMEHITKIRLCSYSNDISQILNYSWPLSKSQLIEKYSGLKYRGAYWNLKYEDYNNMFKEHIIRSIDYINDQYISLSYGKESEQYIKYLEEIKKYRIEYSKDILLWCYISNVGMDKIGLKWYLRIVKILLNYNVVKNNEAWLYTQHFGNYLFYCKNKVYGIPLYYNENGNNSVVNKNDGNENYIYSIYRLNNNIHIKNLKNREAIIAELGNRAEETLKENISKISKVLSLEDYISTWKQLEESMLVNGIVEKFIDKDNNKFWDLLKHYLETKKHIPATMEEHFSYLIELYKIMYEDINAYKMLFFNNVDVRYKDMKRSEEGGRVEQVAVLVSNLMDILYDDEINTEVQGNQLLQQLVPINENILKEWKGFWIKEGYAYRPSGSKGDTCARRTYNSYKRKDNTINHHDKKSLYYKEDSTICQKENIL